MAQIDINDFKPNSNKSKEAPAKREIRAVNTKAKVREKSLGSKFRDTFIGEEIGDAKSYILFDVIVPSIKEMIVDAVENAVEMIFGVGGRSKRPNKDRKSGDSVSYTAYYKSKEQRRDTRRDNTDDGDRYDGKDILVDTRGEAEELLDVLMEQIDMYEKVSVAELYESIGKTPNFTDYKYGWTNLRNAYVKRVRDGYLLVLPKVVPIE